MVRGGCRRSPTIAPSAPVRSGARTRPRLLRGPRGTARHRPTPRGCRCPRAPRRRAPGPATRERAAGSGPSRWHNRRRSGRAAAASSPSALLTSTRSASSITPRLIPCSSSPPAGGRISTNMSTISATAVSAWPTPTVSTNTASNPAASHNRIASRVRRATPPRLVAGRGRPDEGLRAPAPIRPCASCRRGSRRRRASRRDRPRAPRSAGRARCPSRPKRSIKVDLPAPGGPEMPMRMAPPVSGRILDQPFGLVAMVGPVDSTRVTPAPAPAGRPLPQSRLNGRGQCIAPAARDCAVARAPPQ